MALFSSQLRSWAGSSALLLLSLAGAAPAAMGNEPGKEVRYEHLYGGELYQRMEQRPLAWLPLGVLERHGDHLPWGLDGLKAHAVCLYLAERQGGVVLPASHLAGVHGDRDSSQSEAEYRALYRGYGDFIYTEGMFRSFLLETFDGLANIGFKVIVAYTGHYPEAQTRVLAASAEEFNRSGKAVVIPFWEPLACGEGDHGGKWESSIYLALRPDEVRLDAVREDDGSHPGYYRGAPVAAETSPELGRSALRMIEEYLAPRIDRALGH